MTQTFAGMTTFTTASLAYKAGFDGGHADTGFTTFDKTTGEEQTTVIPSTVQELYGDAFQTIQDAMATGQQGGGFIDPYQQRIQIGINGRNFLVGYAVMQQQVEASTQMGNQFRYYSDEQLVRLLGVSGMAIPEKTYTLDIVTTVPFRYSSKELRDRIIAKLSGHHIFTLNGEERQAFIKIHKVLVEGRPALVLYGADSANQRRLIIDGGGYTTEFLTFDGYTPVADKCGGIEVGTDIVGQYVFEYVLKHYNTRLSTQSISNILRAYASRSLAHPLEYPLIACGSQTIHAMELESICRGGCYQMTREVVKFATSLWKPMIDPGSRKEIIAGDIPFQYHLGGASLFHHEELQEHMPRLLRVADPSLANARGCARLAKGL